MKHTLTCLACLSLLLLCMIFSACTGDQPPVETNAPTGNTEATTNAPTGDVTAPSTDPETDPVTDAQTEPVTEPATEPETDYFEASKIELVKPDTSKVPDMAVTDKGYDIYQLTRDKEWGYRYGCTYLYNEDGSVDAYFACVGTESGEWDWIAYRHSPDGGQTWGDEKIVLTPTHGSMDHFSNCDPGVVYFNGYYYLGYTSTLNSTGYCNNLFVARSKNPDGPFEKWNGAGWGGYEPQPIVYYDEAWEGWGIGEPSFVELNGTLYIYYTHTGASGEYMMVATADATNENWPATMKHHGVGVKKTTDSLDVKYVEEWGKFVGVATGDRMGPSSWLGVYESNDGYHFELVDITREGTYSHLHNAGISSRPNGHIRITEDADKLRVIYAYGEGWGTWNTRIQPITLVLSNGNDMNAERRKKCLSDEHLRAELIPAENRHIAMVRPKEDVYIYPLSKGDFPIQLFTYDTYFEKKSLPRNTEGIEFFVYDESVITLKPGSYRATIVGVGTTGVEVRYAGCVYLFYVTITEEPINTGSATTPVKLEPVMDTYTVYIGERSIHRPQLRARMWWADGSFTEYYVDKSDTTITYSDYDEAIISLNDRGVITPRKVGTTTVTLSYAGQTCRIKVVVSGDPADGYYLLGDYAEVNYANLDFSMPGTHTSFTGLHSAQLEHDADKKALKATVTGGDPMFYIPCSRAADPMKAEDYGTMEITYMVPKETSAQARNLQVFFCVGQVTEANASYQVMSTLTCDGQYHTIQINLSKLSYWKGDIHSLRIDFFDQCTVGDVIYIQSIQLLP